MTRIANKNRVRRLAAALVVVALAGCARIPTAGVVQEGDAEVPEQGGVAIVAEGPAPDATPDRIVDGFLLAAAAGLSVRSGNLDFTVARQYLWADAREAWDPSAGVLVYDSTRTERPTDTQVTIEAAVRGKVDAEGRYAEAAPDARETVTFDLVQDSRGQWRISALPDGLILPLRTFDDFYRSARLYFLDPAASMLVPEIRYYPAANLATSLMNGLLAGPSPWWRDALRTAIPAGVRLDPPSVPVDSATGTAEVTLAPSATVQAAERPALMLAQIDATLRQAGVGVRTVEVRAQQVDGEGLVLEGVADLATAGEADLAGGPEMIADGALVTLVGQSLEPVPGVGSLADLDARSPARSEDGSVRVLLDGPHRLVLAPTAEQPATTLVEGQNLAAPSVDRFGWVWTASGGRLVAVNQLGGQAEIAEPPGLTGRDVIALRASRDGTRIALVTEGPDGVAVDVAGVVRGQDGSPQQILDPGPRVGAAVTGADSVVWIDDTQLAVMSRGTASSSIWLVSVGGPSRALPAVIDAVSLAGGRLDRSIIVATEAGGLLRYSGTAWVAVPDVAGVADPSYPG